MNFFRERMAIITRIPLKTFVTFSNIYEVILSRLQRMSWPSTR